MAHTIDAIVHDPAEWLTRIRAEYLEMPGLALTLPQAQRLWNLEPPNVRRIFTELVAAHFLSVTDAGTYVRETAR